MSSSNNFLYQAHPWHGVSPRTEQPEIFRTYVEIVPTDTVKYELDKATGILRVDRPQRFSSMCPTLYGFIPQTYCDLEVGERCANRIGSKDVVGDHDPLDVCILTEKTFAHGGFLACVRPIGGLRMIDGNDADDKIIAVLEGDLAFGHLCDLDQCPKGVVERLQHYFLSYKRRPNDPGHQVKIAEIYPCSEAFQVIACAERDYQRVFRSA